ncbi:Gfo/Idh/MocA family protein [Dactylosporangium fulvum]|uniref:Gfo/Idh/MocA family oxidoreductase n=1 Tax=Dactylosporangium fulvum TaxID=53359 RepID=A0ABY5W248_9ACTN|nr:Gfo/Idh/MocA family oxidoreductase [Dactylosporangium fulvum]UWP83450.1 Gfo/Idh/MocA family oxidoreductase [Dactylosporangium fulvum]
MADRIRWGILSTGSIASKFAEDLRLLPDAELAAVGSRSAETAERFAERHGVARAHGSWQALVEDPEVDAIYVATPHTAHYEATRLSLGAGKATLTEKPFTLDVASAEALVETARSSGVFLMEAMWMRCFPAIRRIAGLIADGAIGDLVSVHADFGMEGPVEETHRLRSRALGGGGLYDVGIYPVTFAHLFLGAPTEIQAWARMSPGGVDENTGMLFGFASGAVAALTCSLIGDSARRATITGTTGRIEVPRNFFCPSEFTLWHGEQPERFEMPFEGWGYHFEAAEVQRCLREGLTESPLIPLSETLEILRVLDVVRIKVGLDYTA